MSDLAAPQPTAAAEEARPPWHGSFVWYELLTTDLDAALDFYGKVVGWTAADHPGSAATGARYAILSAGGQAVGGALQLSDAMKAGGARPGWLGYVGVADTDAAAARLEAAGAAIHVAPSDIPDVGRFALLADPGGAMFYVMTPLPQEAPPAPAQPNAPGRVGWHELYAGNGEEAAFAFYSGAFGWKTETELDMGEMGKYRIFSHGGAAIGGMMDRPKDMPASAWAFYVGVDGIDAAIGRIEAGGGEVLMGPHEVPGGSWIVQARDPQGAHFALVSTRR